MLVCEIGLKSLSKNIASRMALVEILYRVQALRGETSWLLECTGDGELLSAICYLETSDLSQTNSEYNEVAEKAKNLLLETNFQDHMQVELCSRLSRCCLNLKEYQLSMACCKRIAQIPFDETQEIKTELLKSLAKWRASLEWTFGQTLAYISEDRRGSTEEISLCSDALFHFASSVKLCSLLGMQQYPILLSSLKAACNLILDRKIPKSKFVRPLEIAAEHAARSMKGSTTSIPTADIEFLLGFFLLLLDAQSVESRFAEGIPVLDGALSVLPRKYDSLLWQLKVVFLTKTGKGKAEIIKILNESNESPEVTAKIWYTLTQASEETEKKASAFVNAIKVLPDDNLMKAEYMIEYGSWYFSVLGSLEESLRSVRDARAIIQRSIAGSGTGEIAVEATLRHSLLVINAWTSESMMVQTAPEKLHAAREAIRNLTDLLQKTYQAFCRPLDPNAGGKKKTEDFKPEATTEAWPAKPEDWILFEWSNTVRSRVRSDGSNKSVISKMAMLEPQAFLLGLSCLFSLLDQMQMPLECMIVLSAMDLISSEVLDSKEIAAHVIFQMSRVLKSIGLEQAAMIRKKYAEGLLLLGSNAVTKPDINPKYATKCTAVLQQLWLQELRYNNAVHDLVEAERVANNILDSSLVFPNEEVVAEVTLYLSFVSCARNLNFETMRFALESLRACKRVPVYGNLLLNLIRMCHQNEWNNRGDTILNGAMAQLQSLAKVVHHSFDAECQLASLCAYRAEILSNSQQSCKDKQTYEYETEFDRAQSCLEKINHDSLKVSNLFRFANALLQHGLRDPACGRFNCVKALGVLARLRQVNVARSGSSDFALPTEFLVSQAQLLEAKIRIQLGRIDLTLAKKAVKHELTIEEKIAEFVKEPEEPEPYEVEWERLLQEQDEFFLELGKIVPSLRRYPYLLLKANKYLLEFMELKQNQLIKNAKEDIAESDRIKLNGFAYDVLYGALMQGDYDAASKAAWVLLKEPNAKNPSQYVIRMLCIIFIFTLKTSIRLSSM